MKITSSQANKLIKQMEEEKAYWTNKERTSCIYTVAQGEDPLIPDYDYSEVAREIAEIDGDIRQLKHAINLSNVTSTISIGGIDLTIDYVLVEMAQLNKIKTQLDYMRKQQPKSRKENNYNSNTIEYQCINYDLDYIKQQYNIVSRRISEMQLALDKHNQTVYFDVTLRRYSDQ